MGLKKGLNPVAQIPPPGHHKGDPAVSADPSGQGPETAKAPSKNHRKMMEKNSELNRKQQQNGDWMGFLQLNYDSQVCW